MTRALRGRGLIVSVAHRTFAVWLLLVVLAVVPGCGLAAREKAPKTPEPQITILHERNRQVWLGESDDDQMEHAEMVWKAAWAAKPRPSAEITRTEFDLISRTGAMAASYYRNGVDVPAAKKAVGLAVVFQPGKARGVKRGDLVIQRSGPRYYIVGTVAEKDLAAVEKSTYERMGLR